MSSSRSHLATTYLAILFSALSISIISTAARAEDRAPIPLRNSSLTPPNESAGTGLEPEVKVRALIDERGRVANVEVLSIEPSSELDDAFRQRTREQVETWRYAPAIVDGKAVAKTLEWTIQFKAGEISHEAESERELLPIRIFRNAGETAIRQRMLGLSKSKKVDLLKSYSRIAEKHLVVQRRQQAVTPRFVVVSDAEHPDLSTTVAHNLEVALGHVHRLLQPHLEPQPSDVKILVYLFSTRTALKAMQQELMPLSLKFAATYYRPGLITSSLDAPSSDFLVSLLIHEATHAYLDHHVRRPGFAFPDWLEEGFAEYMGNSKITKKGELLPGRTLKRKYVLNHYRDRKLSGASLTSTVAGTDLDHLKQAIRQGKAPKLEDVIGAERNTFYGEQSSLYYANAWLFVHFLRHGQDVWAAHNFPLMMLYLAEGYPAAAAVEAAYGQEAADFNVAFEDYVKNF